jgi:hypothetical protein
MNQKEKSQEMFDKYFEITNNYYQAKECALLSIENILNLGIVENERSTILVYEFYTKVKEELKKL